MTSSLSTRLLNVCIRSLCKVGRLERSEAIVVDGIRLGCLPDVVTYNTLIDGYCRFIGVDQAHSIVPRMKEAGVMPDVITYNLLIAGATRYCLLEHSLKFFPKRCCKLESFLMNVVIVRWYIVYLCLNYLSSPDVSMVLIVYVSIWCRIKSLLISYKQYIIYMVCIDQCLK